MKTSLLMVALFSVSLLLCQTGVNAGTTGCDSTIWCHKGKCWRACTKLVNNPKGNEWCYVKTADYGYTSCKQDSNCVGQGCSPCSGACSGEARV